MARSMNPAALSVAVYGFYLLANGVALTLVPSVPLALLCLPPTQEPWIRLVGLLSGEIGFYFVFAARKDLSNFLMATVYGRATAALVFLGLVMLRLGPMQLLLFAAVDLVTAAWTYFASKRSAV
jgi:hypothetical protein